MSSVKPSQRTPAPGRPLLLGRAATAMGLIDLPSLCMPSCSSDAICRHPPAIDYGRRGRDGRCSWTFCSPISSKHAIGRRRVVVTAREADPSGIGPVHSNRAATLTRAEMSFCRRSVAQIAAMRLVSIAAADVGMGRRPIGSDSVAHSTRRRKRLRNRRACVAQSSDVSAIGLGPHRCTGGTYQAEITDQWQIRQHSPQGPCKKNRRLEGTTALAPWTPSG